MPSRNAQAPSEDRCRSFCKGMEGLLNSLAATFPETINSEMTIKGKREGMTVLAQRERPRLIYSMAMAVFLKIKSRQNRANSPKQICPEVKLSGANLFCINRFFAVMSRTSFA